MKLYVERIHRSSYGGHRPPVVRKGRAYSHWLRIIPHPSKPGRELVIRATKPPLERRARG